MISLNYPSSPHPTVSTTPLDAPPPPKKKVKSQSLKQAYIYIYVYIFSLKYFRKKKECLVSRFSSVGSHDGSVLIVFLLDCPHTSILTALMKLAATARSSFEPQKCVFFSLFFFLLFFSTSVAPWVQCCVPASLCWERDWRTRYGVSGPALYIDSRLCVI